MEKVIHEITGRTVVYKFVENDGVLWLITGKRKGQRLMQKINREEFRLHAPGLDRPGQLSVLVKIGLSWFPPRSERMRGTARI